jgi:hypothetical protein
MASTPTIVREGSDRPPTDLDKKMHETMSAWYQLQDAHDQKAARLDQIEETNRSLMAENENQRQRIADLEHKLGYFIRHSTEIVTRLVDVKKIIDMAGETINTTLIDAQRSGYRPPPAGTPREPQNRPGDDGEPIPRFLQKPPKEDITGQD